MNKKDMLKKFLKSLFIILSVGAVIGLIIIVISILCLFGIIQEYTYIKINDSNKEDVKLLLYEQEHYMFNMTKEFNLENCVDTMKKLEVVFGFPDGEDYVIYCDNTKYTFSLDNTNYDLSKYMKNNGRLWFKIINK